MTEFIPPPKIRSSLQHLRGLCIDKVLDEVRFRALKTLSGMKASSDHSSEDLFRKLRTTGSRWNDMIKRKSGLSQENLLPSHHWRNMGEELLAVDSSFRVQREAKEIQKIFKAVRSVPEYISKMMSKRFPGIQFDIINTDSFASDTMVADLDELDFSLVYEKVWNLSPRYKKVVRFDLRY